MNVKDFVSSVISEVCQGIADAKREADAAQICETSRIAFNICLDECRNVVQPGNAASATITFTVDLHI